MKLKICGLKYPDNIRQVAALGPDFAGFIFYEPSKRFVGHDFVMPEIDPAIRTVGVFVDAPLQYVEEKVKKYRLQYAQLQGHETPAYCAQVKQFTQVIKAFGVGAAFELELLNDYKSCSNYFLFDHRTETYGAAGEPLNLELIAQYDSEVPFFIGGMDMDRLQQLPPQLKPFGIDVSNKAEIKPGYKDIIKMIRLRNRVR